LIFRRFLGLLSLFVIAACQGFRPTTTPGTAVPLQVPWVIQLSPEIRWIQPHLRTCAAQQSGLHLLIKEIPANQFDPAGADITFMMGEPTNWPGSIYQIATESLAIIVHPQNSLAQGLSREQLQGIFSGRITTWSEIGAELKEYGNIELWQYPTSSPLHTLLGKELNLPDQNPANSQLAPSAEAMRSAVSGSKSAVGYIPSKWVDASVHTVLLEKNPMTQYPLLAILNMPPTPAQQTWLLCLQQTITSTGP
jgi:hypothetical protein